MSLIQFNSASKGYSSASRFTPVLRDISLSVNEGDFVSIIGYSGTGKTTLISLIAGMLHPTSGSVEMEGKPINGTGHDRGVIFQNYSLLPWLSVSENIRLAVDEVYPSWPSSQRAEHTAKYVNMVKLGHAANKRPNELSGGMRQRVAVARALAMQPRVLLLDEPLSALDALTRATLQDEISDIWLRNRTTVIWITNDPDEAILMADRVIPLLPMPDGGATLGREIPVSIERPRDRRELHDHPLYAGLRADIIGQLVAAKSAATPAVTKKVSAPDILPEDLMTRDTLRFFNRRGPRRRSDLNLEEVSTAA
jgi:nitrate/nitrite transport system ATP-binding protein